jgi:hypothetical protein
MNPNSVIKKWLIAAGKQFGIRVASDYVLADAKTRPHEMYFTYRIDSSVPFQIGSSNLSTSTGYTVNHKHTQVWITTVVIELHNSQNGMEELASCVIGAQGNEIIRRIFNDQCSSPRNARIDNISIVQDGGEIEYIHRLTCEFEEDVQFTYDETGGLVEQIDLQLDDEYPNHKITEDGIFLNLEIEAGSGDLVVTGTATFVEA